MSPYDEQSFLPEDFSGPVRLFPLPKLVLFPHVMHPLHVFEPRYRELVRESLADDRLLAMTLLSPGWENDYEGSPAVEPIGCLGRISAHHRLENGDYNLLVLGLQRIRLLRELPKSKAFRQAEVEICQDIYPSNGVSRRAALGRRLCDLFSRRLAAVSEMQSQLRHILGNNIPLGVLTDIVGHTLDLSPAAKERLLAERNVDRRARYLLKQLETDPPADDLQVAPFPPEFSAN